MFGPRFQSTLSPRERLLRHSCQPLFFHFNPRSHLESDPSGRQAPAEYLGFQSTLSPRERRSSGWCLFQCTRFQSTLSPRERLISLLKEYKAWQFQSTLSPRERRNRGYYKELPGDFNPRSHLESDSGIPPATDECKHFNPRSHLESDNNNDVVLIVNVNFNPRSHLESDVVQVTGREHIPHFNPRSHLESDLNKFRVFPADRKFQSTLSPRERPQGGKLHLINRLISIHALT